MIHVGRTFTVVTLLTIGLVLSSVRAEPIGTSFSYQGQLKQTGAPVNDTCDMQLTLWDDPTASLVTNQVGPAITFDGGVGNAPSVSVVNGLFQVDLDFGGDAFTGDALWLQVDVCCSSPCAPSFTTLNPRQPLSATPYALHTRGITSSDTGFIGIGTTSPIYPLEVRTSTASRAIHGSIGSGILPAIGPNGEPTVAGTRPTAVEGVNSEIGGVGVSGDTLATTGDARGVLGRTSSDAGVGVLGRAFHPTGNTFGVFGETDSADGIGVVGENKHGLGPSIGVEGRSHGFEGVGVRGVALDLNSRSIGVEGTSEGTDGIGVAGVATATSGIGVGVQGESDSADGTGVVGVAPTKGIIGEAINETGETFGVIGRSASPDGFAGFFEGRGYFSDKVGIGTKIPLAELDVSGSFSVGFRADSNMKLKNEQGDQRVQLFTDVGDSGALLTFGPNGNDNVRISSLSVNNDHGFVSIRDAAGDEKVSVFVHANEYGVVSTKGPMGTANVLIGSLAANNDNGYISISNATGDEKVSAYVHESDSGIVSTRGPNGNGNILISSLASKPNDGFIAVKGWTGTDRALVTVASNGSGLVKTLGINGSENVVLRSSINENQGRIEVKDDNSVVKIDMSVQSETGRIDINNETGAHTLTMSAVSGSGVILARGPNSLTNVFIGNTIGNPNHGHVYVGDSNGQPAAEMFVDFEGKGIVNAHTISAAIKNFRVPNPNQLGTDIWYASLEGPEAAAYFRGTATLVNGQAEITLPEHFQAVSVEAGLTVQLTPLSADSLGLAVTQKSLKGISVQELHRGHGNYEFDYKVTAVRSGYENYRVIRPTRAMHAVVPPPAHSQRRVAEVLIANQGGEAHRVEAGATGGVSSASRNQKTNIQEVQTLEDRIHKAEMKKDGAS